MSSFGLKVKDPSGNLLIDSGKTGHCLIDSFIVAAGVSTSRSYPVASGHTLTANSVRVETTGGHRITISGTTVTVTAILLPSDFIIRQCASFVYVYMR